MATRIMGRTTETELPYGIGRLGGGFVLLATALLALVGVGAYAYTRQFMEGEVVTGMRDIGTMGGAAWGLYIIFVVYFVGVSFAGITVAALIRILNLEYLKPISRAAELLTIVALILAAFSVLADLGNPGRGIINLFRYARPQSPFFGTFSLVLSGYLFASLVYLYLEGRRDAAILAKKPSRLQALFRFWAAGYQDTKEERDRHSRVSFWLAVAILPLLVTAHSTLGLVFGIQAGRPGWFSTLQAPGFVVMAGVSGVGHIIVISAILRVVLKQKDLISMQVFRWLSNFLLILTITYLYFLLVEWLTSTYAAPHTDAKISRELLVGRYSWLFWLSVSFLLFSVVMGFVQFALKRYSIPLLVLCGIMVNVAAVGKRFLIVVPSQTVGTLLPYEAGAYNPTWIEYGVIAGLLALGALVYVVFSKVFPVLEVQAEHKEGRAK